MEPSSFSCHPALLVIPTGANPNFLLRCTEQGRVCAFLLKERRMMLYNATNLYRKFGVAERRDLRFRGPLLKTRNNASRSIQPPREINIVLEVRRRRRFPGVENNQWNIQFIPGPMAPIVVGQGGHCFFHLPEDR